MPPLFNDSEHILHLKEPRKRHAIVQVKHCFSFLWFGKIDLNINKMLIGTLLFRIIMVVVIDNFLWDKCRYFNVIGSDPEGRLGEAPRPELREHGRISGACFDAARGITPGLKVC